MRKRLAATISTYRQPSRAKTWLTQNVQVRENSRPRRPPLARAAQEAASLVRGGRMRGHRRTQAVRDIDGLLGSNGPFIDGVGWLCVEHDRGGGPLAVISTSPRPFLQGWSISSLLDSSGAAKSGLLFSPAALSQSAELRNVHAHPPEINMGARKRQTLGHNPCPSIPMVCCRAATSVCAVTASSLAPCASGSQAAG